MREIGNALNIPRRLRGTPFTKGDFFAQFSGRRSRAGGNPGCAVCNCVCFPPSRGRRLENGDVISFLVSKLLFGNTLVLKAPALFFGMAAFDTAQYRHEKRSGASRTSPNRSLGTSRMATFRSWLRGEIQDVFSAPPTPPATYRLRRRRLCTCNRAGHRTWRVCELLSRVRVRWLGRHARGRVSRVPGARPRLS